ncbi:glycerol-3-phosphate dehydrogenase/oxidase [Cellulomonas fimi]|uniref:Glycerol-3-phosphate dehydrogenase n=1 Tax=Cellulomonas fimi (strain ATCC 484 / DSM 20113 / JCM 1341 / CCUG 24087 / LMG 16345 / NBRC 15513 / NCIMB 8980 / NCTC 7547 / NRS-133) TaxID=590998 RepID=F4H312_CELFA|nr:glycerol-3-phosphate dehydrogenase/oxidase [Cellulomonas fimi]AEE47630.1 Glycerol-3-phosphate dehydrogenase [Cellulomonas fimi ATCC 484]NNH08623.1 glycerol-3-phosphate dehydrogenase/oxidase [Cellulomonas fimi]VEH36680.1 Aerobic glycerol-3-phosphate dehydrogenase [Cellulomonas fimi]
MRTAPLTVQARQDALDTMRASGERGNELDVLVIGGGVTGAGIALDAVTRGLSTAIVEAQDWASGTSSRSSKLVHGGLRYLQMLDFHLVREALTERDLLIHTLAPHLVKPVSFLYPLENRVWERAYVGAGVLLYDTLATVNGSKRAMPMHQHLTRKGMERLFPDLRHDAAVGAVRYWDASVDDARLVETLVRTAVSYGAHAASRTQVLDLHTTSGGAVTGAELVDLETGEHLDVRARAVINATGVWTEETESLAGSEGGLRVLASKGIHIVVPRSRIAGNTGLILQTEKSVLFIIPWSRYWVIGTTDTPWEQDLVHPVATSADIDYVIEHANAVLSRPISRDDVIGTWAGLRPLLQPHVKEGTSSAKVSREHTVASPTPGLTVIAGGKLTTYRVMAKDAVDFAIGSRATSLPSLTHDLPLVGAEGLRVLQRQAKAIGARYGWDRPRMDHLLHRYGSLLGELIDLVDAEPSLAEPLANAPAYIGAEIVYAVSHEGALHLDDVMMHRTRLNYEQADKGVGALEEIADLVAPVLGWDERTRSKEIAAYTARAEAEDAAAQEHDDATAERVRLRAADLAPMRRLDDVVDAGTKPGSPRGRGSSGPAGT